jgi:hypothetical protein
MKPLPFHVATGFSDFVDRVHEAAFDERFPANGSFVKMSRNGKDYWYHSAYDAATPEKRRMRYVGPVGDPGTDRLVLEHGPLKSDYKARKELASSLRRAGLPAPDGVEGDIAAALQRAGLFASGAILIGSVAYQTYGGLLGVRLEGAHHRTQDIDLAQDRDIAVIATVEDSKSDDIESILKGVDPTFRPVFNAAKPSDGPTRYVNATQYKVDFLTAPKPSDRDRMKPVPVPVLPGAALQPLELMDALIARPVRSALLHGAGVGVVVPEPAIYAVHKLAVSQMRGDMGEAGKSAKDVAQAGELIEALVHARRSADLADAFADLFGRKEKWKRKLLAGALALDGDHLDALAKAVADHGGPLFRRGEDPAGAITQALHGRRSGGTEANPDDGAHEGVPSDMTSRRRR